MEAPPILEKKRYHDLDALRAGAMLLGILLHGVISFMGEKYWPIQDSQSPYWDLPAEMQEAGTTIGMELPDQISPYKFFFMQAIHGFRMPLFFVVSGFFVAMLWRQKGIREMLKHRTKRILLPFLGMGIVFIPATWIAMIGGGFLSSLGNEAPRNPQGGGLWAAAERGNVDAIYQALENGTDINGRRKDGQTPLNLAVFNQQHEAARILLEKGADVNSVNGDQRTTPLHTATFLADERMVLLLLKHDADTEAKDKDDATPVAVVQGEWTQELEGLYKFIGGLTRRNFDLERIKRDRVKVREILIGDQTATQREDTASTEKNDWDFPGGAELKKRYEALPGWAKGVSWVIGGIIGIFWVGSMIPAFHHLWFLFYLMVIIGLFALLMWIAKKRKFRPWGDWVVQMPYCLLWLFPLTFLVQVTMWQSFGPDTHTGPLPWPPKVFYYCIFFGFGALCYGRETFGVDVGQYWWLSFVVAIPVLLLGVGYLESRNVQVFTQLGQGNLKPVIISHLIASACMALYCWLMIFGCIGFFRQIFSQENKTIRYISDSSYWLYVAHMPLMMLLQGLVAPWGIPSSIKFLLVCGITVGLLLVCYEYFVRYTFIGTFLNGKREREKPQDLSASQSAA